MEINLRLVVLLALIALASWYILSPVVFRAQGVVVMTVEDTSKCNIAPGDIITQVGISYVTGAEDFRTLTQSVRTGDRVTMIVNNGPGGCTAVADGDIGIQVSDIPRSGIRFGSDLVGGERVLFHTGNLTETEIVSVEGVMSKRVVSLKAPDTRVYISGEDVVVETPDFDYIRNINIPGELLAEIEWQAKVSNGTGEIRLGKNSFSFSSNGSVVEIAGIGAGAIGVGDRFELGGMDARISNITNASLRISAIIFSNDDVVQVLKDSEYTKLESQTGEYYTYIPVEVTSVAGARFAMVTDGLPTVAIGTQNALDGALVFSLDGKEVSRLSIPLDMAGQNISSVSIIAKAGSVNEALSQKSALGMSLSGGKLSTSIDLGEIDGFTGYFDWAKTFIIAAFAAIAGVFSMSLFIMMKTSPAGSRVRAVAVGLFFLVFETVLLLGLAAFSATHFSPGWVLNVPSFTGMIIFSSISAAQYVILARKTPSDTLADKVYGYSFIAASLVGLIMVFTPISGVGMALLAGTILGYTLTKPMYKEFLS